MNLLIETLNAWAEHSLQFAWPMFWQSSLLIGLLFVLDLLMKRKLRPAVRYALWLVVLVKLLLPPSLAFPTNPGWWLRSVMKAAPARPRFTAVVVTYGASDSPALPVAAAPVFVAPARPYLSTAAWAFLGMASVGIGLFAWMLIRWQQVARDVRRAAAAPARLCELLPELRRPLRIRLMDHPQSPAVCGLFRPVIMLPRSLAEHLPPAQLRAVLLHELLHLRRGDVWVNCAQALLQVVYWWHPLLWLANARIRRVREEAVDDAVMLALNEDAEAYAPTLLEVAKLALHRPLATLGLIGILESRSSLRQRIERLMDFPPPRKARLTIGAALAILGFAALALPMGEAPAPSDATQSATSLLTTNNLASDAPPSSGMPGAPQPLYAPGTVPERLSKPATTNGPVPNGFSNPGMTTEQKVKAGTLTQDGKLLYEMRKLDEAEAKLKLALNEDPNNQAALYYLDLVAQARPTRTGGLRKVPPSPRRELLPVPNPYSRTNLVRTSQGRQAIIRKLDSIRLDSVSFEGLPLGEVLRSLADEAKKRDPDKLGVNFMIASPELAKTPWETGLDSLTGLPKPATPADAVDPSSAVITIKYPLTNIRLGDALDAIVKVASQPIKYSIEDYAVVFSARSRQEPNALYIRTFKVDPNMLLDGLGTTKALAPANGPGGILPALRDFFAKAGVVLEPPKSIFFNDRMGMLMVRATMQDLDIIEVVIQTLNFVPPQVNIKVKFVEVPQDDTKALGFDWYLGSVLMNPGAVGGQAGTASTNTGSPGFTNPLGLFPGNPPDPAPANMAPNSTNQVLSSGLTNSSKAPSTITGILTDPQYRVVMKALQQRSGTELIAQPEITISSGRQGQMKAVEIQHVAKGISQQALTPPGITTTNNDENTPYVTESMEFGQSLDVIPSVLADGYTIALTVIPTVTEFLGYREDQTNRVAVYVNGKKKWVIPPEPIVRIRQMSTSVRLWDGQTVVLGGLPSETVSLLKDKVPLLGDLPLVGRLFRSESKAATKKNLLIFVTPTLIDPTGNRIHAEDEMPFSRDAIPPQAPR